jgi:hypothetical protein
MCAGACVFGISCKRRWSSLVEFPSSSPPPDLSFSIHLPRASAPVHVLQQFIWLWERVQGMTLLLNTPNKFIWRWLPSKQYSSSSAYRAFFHEQCSLFSAKELAKTSVPPRCKFFLWLVLLDRCWTVARPHRHNLQEDDSCAFCSESSETLEHLMLTCSYSREIWFKLLQSAGWQHLAPSPDVKFPDWWFLSWKRVHKELQRGFDSFFLLVAWSI